MERDALAVFFTFWVIWREHGNIIDTHNNLVDRVNELEVSVQEKELEVLRLEGIINYQ